MVTQRSVFSVVSVVWERVGWGGGGEGGGNTIDDGLKRLGPAFNVDTLSTHTHILTVGHSKVLFVYVVEDKDTTLNLSDTPPPTLPLSRPAALR